MPKDLIPLEYSHFLGALLSSQFPYMFMIGCGYFFGKVGLLQKEGLISFGKMNIEIFLPTYLFIQVCRSIFVLNIEEYYIIILSFLFYFIIATMLSFLYAVLSKMDLRYRFTFVSITAFVDIRRLHYLYINSMCVMLKSQWPKEMKFCSNVIVHSNVHAFFQGVLIWYLSFNLIRVDRFYMKHLSNTWDKIMSEPCKNKTHVVVKTNDEEDKLNPPKGECDYFKEDKTDDNDNNNNNKDNADVNKDDDGNGDNTERFTVEQRKILKQIYIEHQIVDNKAQTGKKVKVDEDIKDDNKKVNDTKVEGYHVYATQIFYDKINRYSKMKMFNNNKSCCNELIYILLRAPLIGLFTGFVVGFIRVIREWIYDTTTPVYLFFDTFNNIANCNILLGFLMIGANLVVGKENYGYSQAKIRVVDYVMHCVIKIIIMPFLGIVFAYIVFNEFVMDNRVLVWAAYIQWMLPTSIEIICINQVKDINPEFVGICLFIQYVAQMLLNNLINVPPLLKVLGILDD
jgi:predicted permease